MKWKGSEGEREEGVEGLDLIVWKAWPQVVLGVWFGC